MLFAACCPQLIERNKLSRDFDRIMKVKKLHDLSAELGVAVAELLVLLNNWKALLRVIGGFQYVGDLEGIRKTHYDLIRSESIRLMGRRRRLMTALEMELQHQYQRVMDVSHDAGVQAANQHWDSPTPVEVEAEVEENRECCRREADFELRQRRQTEHVHIPPAPFLPVLLLVDARLPRKLRAYLHKHLKRYDFEECPVHQNERDLQLAFQRIFDRDRHVLFFVNRGGHSKARLHFAATFSSVLSCLIPRPRVVAVDCTLAMRVNDWHSVLAPEQEGVLGFDIENSAQCDLSVGKLRRFARLFRRCLQQYEDSDSDYADSDNSDEDGDSYEGWGECGGGGGGNRWWARSSGKGGGAGGARAGSVNQQQQRVAGDHDASDTVEAGANPEAVVGHGSTPPTVAGEESKQAADTTIVSGEVQPAVLDVVEAVKAEDGAGEEGEGVGGEASGADQSRENVGPSNEELGAAVRRARGVRDPEPLVLPPYLLGAFYADFHSFMASISQRLSLSLMKRQSKEFALGPACAATSGGVGGTIKGAVRSLPATKAGRLQKERALEEFKRQHQESHQQRLQRQEEEAHQYVHETRKERFSEQQLQSMQYSDAVLAATLAAILGHWSSPPLIKWTMRDVAMGCRCFRDECREMNYSQFSALLELKRFLPHCDLALSKRLDRALQLTGAWRKLQSLEFYTHPARYLLTKWCLEIASLVRK